MEILLFIVCILVILFVKRFKKNLSDVKLGILKIIAGFVLLALVWTNNDSGNFFWGLGLSLFALYGLYMGTTSLIKWYSKQGTL